MSRWAISLAVGMEQKFGNLVELPGSRPPGPKSRTNAFSRLSFDFVLGPRASRNRNRADGSSCYFGRFSERISVLAGFVDGEQGDSGDLPADRD